MVLVAKAAPPHRHSPLALPFPVVIQQWRLVKRKHAVTILDIASLDADADGIKYRSTRQKIFRCSLNEETPRDKHGVAFKQLMSCLTASLLFISPPSQLLSMYAARTLSPKSKGRVQCLSEEDMASAETDLERQEMIRGKCFLRFPTLPFIPKEPYDVLATGYDNYAIVSEAKDTSFIQIYSRTPNPGQEFIQKYKSYAANFGYDPRKINDTPQDCEYMSSDQLALMMSMPGMNEALTNQFPDLKQKAPVALDPFTSVFDTLKKLLELYFK